MLGPACSANLEAHHKLGSSVSGNALSSFTSHGYQLYGVAPGENITGALPGNQSTAYKGTSFAAPMFTGAGALALSEISRLDRPKLNDYFWASLNFGFATALGIEGARLLNVESLIRTLPGFSEPQYVVKNLNSSKFMEVYGGSLSNGGNVDQWWCHSGTANRWKLKPGGEFYWLINVGNIKVLDVAGASASDGANVQRLPGRQ